MKDLETKIKIAILEQTKIVDLLTENKSIEIDNFPIVIKQTRKQNYRALCHKNKIEIFVPLKMSAQQQKEIPIILMHEYFHLCIDQNASLTLIMSDFIDKNKLFFRKFYSSRLSPWIVLHELIVSSFVPEGYLGQKMGYDINYKEKTKLGKARLIVGQKMYSLAKKYIDKKIPIDHKYIKAIVNVLN